MKELIILIIVIILFGVGCASPPNMKREGYYLPSEGGAIPPVGPPWPPFGPPALPFAPPPGALGLPLVSLWGAEAECSGMLLFPNISSKGHQCHIPLRDNTGSLWPPPGSLWLSDPTVIHSDPKVIHSDPQ